MNNPKITIHMVASLDGIIAKPDESVKWMESKSEYANGIDLTEEEINAFLQSVDCYIMGSNTYESALKLGWPYGDTPVIVLTSRELKKQNEKVSFYLGDLNVLMKEKLKNFSNIWLVGGSETIRSFLEAGLANEVVYTIAPILLGNGIPFFKSLTKDIQLELYNHRAYTNGMVELSYILK